MKRFLIVCISLFFLAVGGIMVYYRTSFYIDLQPDAPVTSFTGTEGKQILVDSGNGLEPFEIRGVDMGVGKPGYFATEYAITQEEYFRWFGQIQEMGANCVRIYTIHSPAFYEAFYQYNRGNSEPLYLLHGLWVNDYLQNSHRDAYDPEFINPLLEEAKILVDVIHGRRTLSPAQDTGSGRFRRDISDWVLGYILGVEWEDLTVAFTDHMEEETPLYQGTYFYATSEASPFESMLAQLGDTVASYEAGRYKEQRLIAFSNWPTTDPMTYPENVTAFFRKIAQVDVEHIQTTKAFQSGQFASYHIYPYYPDYLYYSGDSSAYVDESGQVNTYRAYLKSLTEHHSMPVVISEFGVPTSRGMAQEDHVRGLNQGAMSEEEQGLAIVACYEDIQAAGCAGCVIFTWQDEWFKRTWNTMHAVDLNQTAYWSDVQTNEQFFGLLAFDPGTDTSVCYVDGDRTEWEKQDQIGQQGGFTLSMKYDEKYLYFLVEGPVNQETVYLPLDITPNSGSYSSASPEVSFDRAADFLAVLDGEENSRVLVQERYDCLRAMYGRQVFKVDPYEFPPALDSDSFGPIRLVLQVQEDLESSYQSTSTYETGRLRCGNGNPNAEEFYSLTDFCYGDGFLELRLPWQLLNFSNPSDMMIHDDYYLHYGVEEISLSEIWVGAGSGEKEISLFPFALQGWGNQVTYHERLKESYYIIQELWT